MAQKFVGVDLGSHHVKVVVASAGLRGVQVTDAFEEPVGQAASDDPEADPLGAMLAVALGVLKHRRLLSYPMGLVLPPSLCSYRVLTFPFSDERRIAQAVGFEAEGQFPVPVEELFLGHLLVSSGGAEGKVLLAAARRDRVESIVEIFKRAGVELKAVTSGAMAMGQIAARPVATPVSPELSERGLEPVSLVVDLGHESTQLVAMGPKGPRAVRAARRGGRHITEAIAKAYDMSPLEAETAKHRDAFLPHHGLEQMSEDQLDAGRIVAQAIEPVLRELGHTRMWLRATHKLEVTELVLAGGGAALQGLVPYLSEQTGLQVKRLMPSGTLVKGTQGRDWTIYAGALGAAYGAARRPLLQLHDSNAVDGEGGWIQERISSLIAIGVAVMAFGALDTIAQVKALEAEKAAYEDELAAATLETFGEVLGPSKIESKIASVEGQDLTSLVPEKGALEVLAMVTEAATPSDLGSAPPPGAALPAGSTGIDPETGQPVTPGEDGGDEEDGGGEGEGDEATEEAPKKEPQGPIDLSRGIVMSDELTFGTVDIRERKLELKVDANASSAQDRLNFKLKQNSCISNIQNGKVRNVGERKSFEMSMDNNCYFAQPEEEEAAEGEGAKG
ncbi:MAG: pilus assembly protein PilM [Myxococcales bacterium]|nr:pilus assembly protein PilM [Myxococcales bacterium]MCB9715250.1 pilus assembly protein PilM [Myxococcales bacterium]